MGNVTGKSISFKEMCELSDLVCNILFNIVLAAEPEIFKSHPLAVAAFFKHSV